MERRCLYVSSLKQLVMARYGRKRKNRYYTVDITQDTASGSLPKPHSQNFKHLSETR